mgnify:CR=1 FL=1
MLAGFFIVLTCMLLMATAGFLAGDNVTASTRRYAAYAQDEWSVGKQWGFYAGLRWEAISTSSEGDGSATAASSTAAVLSDL